MLLLLLEKTKRYPAVWPEREGRPGQLCPTFCLATVFSGLGYLIGAFYLGVLALGPPCLLCPLLLSLSLSEAVKMA